MPTFEITSPDGRKFRVNGPEGSTQEQALAQVQSQYNAPKADAPREDKYIAPHNVIMGALKGASDIGTTLLRPVDAVLNATGISDRTNKDRKASMQQFFRENADPESLAFKGGDLAAGIAGTAGIGGVLGKAAGAAGASPKVIAALESGGFRLDPRGAQVTGGAIANTALRAGAGAAGGAAAAGLINPEDAGAGAVIGGALPVGVKAAGALGTGVRSAADHILGAMTGTSSETVREAFKAGKTGATDFLDNMRGKVPFDDIVDAAKQGLRNMRQERSQAYRSGMVNIKGDKTVLDMTPIVQSVQQIQSSGNFKGKVINEKAAGTIQEIADKVNDWAGSKAADFHTPEGLDALKQAIGDIRDATQFGTPARRAADNVYNTIKSQIAQQAPTYEKVMGDYSAASRELQEIEKALSVGDKASKDTAIRKLQSLMRNNAQSNYGNRLQLGETLETKGGVSLKPAIAGQAMSAMLPRGMVGAIEKVGMAGAPFVAPGMLAAAPLTSPRLVGEGMYAAGRLAGGGKRSLNALAARTGIPVSALSQLSNPLENPVVRNALIQAESR